MAETYEYPPLLKLYCPLQFNCSGNYPESLKIRHHFFITRAKIIPRGVEGAEYSPGGLIYAGGNGASRICSHYNSTSPLFQHNVLISQGWCAALGVPVPSPFFLQEYLLGSFDDPARDFRHIPLLMKILLTLEVSDKEWGFHGDIMDANGKWWLNEESEPLSFNVLWQLLEQRTGQVWRSQTLSTDY
jgi:hypothetical protein